MPGLCGRSCLSIATRQPSLIIVQWPQSGYGVFTPSHRMRDYRAPCVFSPHALRLCPAFRCQPPTRALKSLSIANFYAICAGRARLTREMRRITSSHSRRICWGFHPIADSASRCSRPPTSQNVLTTSSPKPRAERGLCGFAAIRRDFSMALYSLPLPTGEGNLTRRTRNLCVSVWGAKRKREGLKKSPGLRWCRMRVNQRGANSEVQSEWLQR